MTKPRAARSLEKALIHVADTLPGGFDDMAEVTNRSPWLCRAWADPEKRDQVPVRDALLLDKACAAAGGGTPIGTFYLNRLDEAGLLVPADAAALARHAASVVRECGQAGAALIEASQPGSTPAQRAAARREVEEALAALERALPMLMGGEAFRALFPSGRAVPEEHATGPPH